MTTEIDAEGLAAYDAGLLNDFGGGNVEWWQDYIRAELGRAHDFYAEQFAASRSTSEAEPAAVPEWWLLRGFPVRAPNDKRKGHIASEVTPDGTVFVDYTAGGGRFWAVHELTPWEDYRDVLGRRVREAWVEWAKRQPSPKPSWLVPYDELTEPDKEADRQIGEALVSFGRTHPTPASDDQVEAVYQAILKAMPPEALSEIGAGELERVAIAALAAMGSTKK